MSNKGSGECLLVLGIGQHLEQEADLVSRLYNFLLLLQHELEHLPLASFFTLVYS
jgi:hypothetical protein